MGKPAAGIEVEVREGDELWLRSPTQMAGYWSDPDATAEAIVDGWLRTGDLAAIDDRGNVRLLGRAKEMFIRRRVQRVPRRGGGRAGRPPARCARSWSCRGPTT